MVMLLDVITAGRKAQREAQRNVRQRCGTGGRTMGRMIGTDALLKHFEMIQEQENAIGLDFVAITDEIKEQPTAYDVDAVVKQLEEMRSLYQRLSELKDRDHMKYIYKIEALNDAIEIVKGGGVDGN